MARSSTAQVERPARTPRTRRRVREPPLVVLQQQPPRARVPLDDLEHGPALVGDELVPLQRASEQAHGLLHLAQPLLAKAPLVQRVAVEEVLAQRASGPDAELSAALGVDAVAHREDRVEVVVLDLVGLPVACAECCIFCNN